MVFQTRLLPHFVVACFAMLFSFRLPSVSAYGGTVVGMDEGELGIIQSRQFLRSRYHPTAAPLPMAVLYGSDTDVDVGSFGIAVELLTVDQSHQMMYAFSGGEVVRVMPVSTGLRMSYTPPFDGKVGRYVPRLWGHGMYMDHAWYITKATGNIYLHGAPYTVEEQNRDYVGLEYLGIKPSSHGCIRIHPDDAIWLAEHSIEGVPIRVTGPDFEKWPD